jgi:hypothetical protein
MSEFGKLLLYTLAFSLLVIAGATIPVWLHTGSILAVVFTGLFVIASGIWGWIVAGIDYRSGKE